MAMNIPGLQSFSSSLQQCGMRGIHIWPCCLALASGLVISNPLMAASEYCDAIHEHHKVSLGYGYQQQSSLDSATGTAVAITTNQASFNWLLKPEPSASLALGVDFQYSIMDFEGITPMTNGHLHNWSVPVSGNHKTGEANVFYYLTPAISVSSNALRNTELLDSQALQLNTGLIYKKDLRPDLAWVIGLMSDHRFGDYRFYPAAGVCWQPAKDWLLQLALPDFKIRKSFSGGIQLGLYIAPEGRQWHVFSKDEQRSSDFRYNAITTGLTAHWAVTPAIGLSLELVKHTRRELRIVLDNNSLIEPNAASSTGLRVSGEILF